MSYGRSALAEEATIGFENDAWAVGATIFEVVTGIALFQTEDQVLSLVQNHELLEKEIDEKLGELLFQHGLSRAPEAQGVDAFAMHALWNVCCSTSRYLCTILSSCLGLVRPSWGMRLVVITWYPGICL